jgi:hypothetical protein
MRTSSAALLAALACAAASLAAGCGDDDVVLSRFSPTIVAATAPDSVAAGQALDVKVHWRAYNSCQSFEKFNFTQVDDTTFHIIAFAIETVDPNSACTPTDAVREASFHLASTPPGRFVIEVYGAAQRIPLEIQGGAQPAATERHAILVTNAAAAGGPPVEGALARVIDAASTDTIAVLVTGAGGDAESTLACGAVPRSYRLLVTGASGRQALLDFVQNPAHCGVPERTKIRL